MNISVNNIIIEVTRRCNFNCDHCLRGHSQAIDIELSTLRTIAKNIYANNVVFTGGEPALNIKGMKKYIEYTKKYNTFPSSFWLATNGTRNQLELAGFLLQLYTEMDNQEMCGVAVSRDYFHEEYTNQIDRKGMEIFKALNFYDESKDHGIDYDEQWVLKRGNAKENDLGGYFHWRDGENGDNELDVEIFGGDIWIDQLYVSANGFCVACCDLPYEEVDTHHLCHISELKSFLKKVYKQEIKASVA